MIDPNFPSAKIIAHSRAPNGEELITMEIELHRFILPEFNTHRSFSRNFQSSRAVPIEKMIEQVRNDLAFPVHWGKNQKGMVAEYELTGDEKFRARNVWVNAAQEAADYAQQLVNKGVHKQVVNRLLEPFMKTKGVVTATRKAFDAFFKLRCHKDAQPEIKLLAERMREAILSSIPVDKKYGEYHLPYVNVEVDEMLTEEAVKISTSCCAQVSYRQVDDSLAKALKIYDMLNLPVGGKYPEDPPHFSPTEHIAKVVEDVMIEEYSNNGETFYFPDQTGNFNSCTFWQYRKALEQGLEELFLE